MSVKVNTVALSRQSRCLRRRDLQLDERRSTYSTAMMSGETKFLKCTLFAFNLMFAASGLALIITGIVIHGSLQFLGSAYLAAPLLFVLIGSIVCSIAFFGCCGVVRDSGCMLTSFSCIMGLFFVCELSGGLAGYVLHEPLYQTLQEEMIKSLLRYNATNYEEDTSTWDYVQHNYQCCGVYGYKDWNNSTFSQRANVPDSCCELDIAGCGRQQLKKLDPVQPIYTNGCYPTLKDQLAGNSEVFMGVAIAVGIVQLVGINLACALASSRRRNYETI